MTLTPVNLYFEDSGEWYTLPDWAEYFIGIGKQLSSVGLSTSRLVTAIVSPSRAYCAVFVTLGMIVCDAAKRDHPSEEAHFEKLLRLPLGTPVIFRQEARKVMRGVLRGPENCCGELCVRVQVESMDIRKGGGLTFLIDKSHALEVQPAKHSGKLPKVQGAENKRFTNRFVDILLGDADPVQLGLRSKLVCAIVGKKTVLEHEILHTPLAIHANGDCRVDGKLQDVLRVDRFVSAQQSYRSALVPVGPGAPSGDVTSKTEMAVVFDGAAGFLKWGSMWSVRNHIIILDRTELNFDDAISAINSRLSQNRMEVEFSLPVSTAPPGVEVLAFQETIL